METIFYSSGVEAILGAYYLPSLKKFVEEGNANGRGGVKAGITGLLETFTVSQVGYW